MIKVLVTRRLKDYLIFISIETSYELSSVRQRESVTTVEVTLVSDTVTPLLVTLGHPMVDPTLLFPLLNILTITIFTFHSRPDSLAFFWSDPRVWDQNLPPLVL